MPAGENGWPSSNFLPHVPSEEGEQTSLIDALQDWKSDKYRDLIGEPMLMLRLCEAGITRNIQACIFAMHKWLCNHLLQCLEVVKAVSMAGCAADMASLLSRLLKCSQQQPTWPCLSPNSLSCVGLGPALQPATVGMHIPWLTPCLCKARSAAE